MKRTAAGFLAAAIVAAALPWPAAPETPRPHWVDRFPHDPERYLGVGRADKRTHPDSFRELALASALAQISRGISVEIAAVDSATRTENAGGAEETYAGHVELTTRNALAGYTLEAVYETSGEFWACYALEKGTWERAQAEKARALAAAMDQGLAGVEAEAAARRIQSAGERLEGLRKAFAAALVADPGLRDRSRLSGDRLSAWSAKLDSALGTARLALSPGQWTFSMGIPGAPDHEARAVLRDPDAAMTWLGPLSLRISEWPAKAAAECRVQTDAAGRLDLAVPFRACGLASGTWRVAWTPPGPEKRELHAEIPAEWLPVDVALAIRQDPAAQEPVEGDAERVRNAIPQLRAALEGWGCRRYRIVSGKASLPVVEARIREVTLDSLEGMRFASIRAWLAFPGSTGTVEVRGKAGHADGGRALLRAAADFAREAALAADQPPTGPGIPYPTR